MNEQPKTSEHEAPTGDPFFDAYYCKAADWVGRNSGTPVTVDMLAVAAKAFDEASPCDWFFDAVAVAVEAALAAS